MLNINPWLKIWTSPKETIQAVVNHDPKYRFNVFCFIYGFVWCLQTAQILMLGHYYSVGAIMILSALLSVPIGYILMNITTAFFYLAGKLFRGHSDYLNVRAVVGWSNLPSLANIILWIGLVIFYGSDIFVTANPDMASAFNFAIFAMGVQFIAGIWGLVILIGGIAQVQKFSNLRSFGSLILVCCMWLVLTVLLVYLLTLSSQANVAVMSLIP